MIYILHHLSLSYCWVLNLDLRKSQAEFHGCMCLKGWAQGKVIACIQWLIQRSRRSPDAKGWQPRSCLTQISEARDNATPIGKGGRRCKTSRNNRTAESPHAVAMSWIHLGSRRLSNAFGSWVTCSRQKSMHPKAYQTVSLSPWFQRNQECQIWILAGLDVSEAATVCKILTVSSLQDTMENEANIIIAYNCCETKFIKIQYVKQVYPWFPAHQQHQPSTPAQVVLPKWLCFDKRHQAKVASRLDWTPQPFVQVRRQYNSSCCSRIAKARIFSLFCSFWVFLAFSLTLRGFALILEAHFFLWFCKDPSLLSGFAPVSTSFLRWYLG